MIILEDTCKAGKKKKLITTTKNPQNEEKPVKDQKNQVCALQIITFSQTEASLKSKSAQVIVEKTDKCLQTRNVPLNERSV
ncbi:hypothetical protein CEXT_676551 [Caerostris extrusa]|uniref:Uncharacterized protein n=1 Tax=Caerostris extrusa TaxID=172846 RepID=A0AAV4U3B3_CAEEX|nr:hypothetical protein CEXT_676551 [Caerostris extrusa]